MLSFQEFIEAKQNGIYVGLRLAEESKEKICDFVNNNLYLAENHVESDDLHCTLIYSRLYDDVQLDPGRTYYCKPKHIQRLSDSLVIVLDAPLVVQRHNQLMTGYNLQYDYDEYLPHVTIAYDYQYDSIPELKGIDELILTGEYLEPLKTSEDG